MTKLQIDYITSVIGALSLITGLSCAVINKILKSAEMIHDYLVGAYEVLHTFSLEYIAEDMIELMKKKGNALW